MKSIKQHFKDKTPEQIFTFFLLCGSIVLMLVCAVVRLCGGDWLAADITAIPVPSPLVQEIVMAALLVFEQTFVFKILCRASWGMSLFLAIAEALLGILIGYLTGENRTATNIFYMACVLIFPIFFTRKWYSIIENAILYGMSLLYGVVFLVGRIGDMDVNTYNFVTSVLSTIDYKIFFVSLYLYIKYYGGIKLWKIVIFKKDLKTRKTHTAEVAHSGSSETNNPPTTI